MQGGHKSTCPINLSHFSKRLWRYIAQITTEFHKAELKGKNSNANHNFSNNILLFLYLDKRKLIGFIHTCSPVLTYASYLYKEKQSSLTKAKLLSRLFSGKRQKMNEPLVWACKLYKHYCSFFSLFFFCSGHKWQGKKLKLKLKVTLLSNS